MNVGSSKKIFVEYLYFAKILDYPTDSLKKDISYLISLIDKNESKDKIILPIKEFLNVISKKNIAEIQEIYIKSFEIQSIVTLNIGYLIYGDDYKRAELLINLNNEYKNINIKCENDLSDYLPNILIFLSKCTNINLINEFVSNFLIPSLKVMIDEFEPEKIDQRNKMYKKHHKTLIEDSKSTRYIYKLILDALLASLYSNFNIKYKIKNKIKTISFSRNIEQEIILEDENLDDNQ